MCLQEDDEGMISADVPEHDYAHGLSDPPESLTSAGVDNDASPEYLVNNLDILLYFPGAGLSKIRHRASHKQSFKSPSTIFVFFSKEPHQCLHYKLFCF